MKVVLSPSNFDDPRQFMHVRDAQIDDIYHGCIMPEAMGFDQLQSNVFWVITLPN